MRLTRHTNNIGGISRRLPSEGYCWQKGFFRTSNKWTKNVPGMSYVPPEKVFVQLFFTQFKASENAVILMMVVVQTGQLIFYETLVQDRVGVFYTIQKWNLHNFKTSLQEFFSNSKRHIQSCKHSCTITFSGTNTFSGGTGLCIVTEHYVLSWTDVREDNFELRESQSCLLYEHHNIDRDGLLGCILKITIQMQRQNCCCTYYGPV